MECGPRTTVRITDVSQKPHHVVRSITVAMDPADVVHGIERLLPRLLVQRAGGKRQRKGGLKKTPLGAPKEIE
jgi:hypothetical protein